MIHGFRYGREGDEQADRRKRLMDEHKRHKRRGETKPGCPWCTTKKEHRPDG